jgi:uncharacterized DUF497 family protein
MVEFEWFEEKRLWTLKDRRMDFYAARQLFDGRSVCTISSPRHDEERFVTTGILNGEFVTAVWMWREGVIRIISMRRARRAEEKRYCALHGGRN